MSATEAFLQARDFLLANSTDYATAYRDFAWPRLDEFNWALDYFDSMANGNHRPALRVLSEFGAETIRTFAELSAAILKKVRMLPTPIGRHRADSS